MPFDEILSGEIRAAEQGRELGESPVRELEAVPWALDGNSVNPEREAVKLTENSLLYNALTTGMSKRLSMLRYAATDGRS